MNDFSIPGHVDDYGIPPSPYNWIEPGKKPMSSMSPIIILDKKGKFDKEVICILTILAFGLENRGKFVINLMCILMTIAFCPLLSIRQNPYINSCR